MHYRSVVAWFIRERIVPSIEHCWYCYSFVDFKLIIRVHVEYYRIRITNKLRPTRFPYYVNMVLQFRFWTTLKQSPSWKNFLVAYVRCSFIHFVFIIFKNYIILLYSYYRIQTVVEIGPPNVSRSRQLILLTRPRSCFRQVYRKGRSDESVKRTLTEPCSHVLSLVLCTLKKTVHFGPVR